MITINDFAAIEIRVGKVLEATNKEGSEKLIRLKVDFGEFGQRVIFTGVRTFGYSPEDFSGKQFLFITNLEYRKMLDEESQGMILAVDSTSLPQVDDEQKEKPLFISAEGLPAGSKVR